MAEQNLETPDNEEIKLDEVEEETLSRAPRHH